MQNIDDAELSELGEDIFSKAPTEEEDIEEITLRPLALSDFVGQDGIKRNLGIAIEAAKKRNETIEHVLLHGNPGLGKTTLAHIIARETQGPITITSGPALARVGDLASILSNVPKGGILFIDEIHRMSRSIEEVLYPAMEDFVLDIILGKGPGARTVRLPLEKFTLIGATTRMSMLSGPLRDRFGHHVHLDYYSPDDLIKIIKRSGTILGIEVDDASANLIALRSRGTPRIANRILKRVRDFAQVEGTGVINESITKLALESLLIDDLGLDERDREILKTIIEKFSGGPVGLSTIAVAVSEDIDTLESVYEPFLIQCGMMERTLRGRKVTDMAYKHLGYSGGAPKGFI